MKTIIFTKEHLDLGMSSNGFWSMKQLRLLDVNHKVSGWKDRAIGKEYPEEVIDRFIALKDAHLVDGKNIFERKAEAKEERRRLKAKKSKTVVSQREKDYRSADWKSEQDRMRRFDYLTEGI